MKKRILVSVVVIIVIVVAVIVALFSVVGTSKYATVKGKIADELSGDPVRGTRMVIDGRSTILYQTTRYEITRIPPGEHTLEVSPPSGWVKFTKTMTFKKGDNQLDIALKGEKIPDLTGIICFTESEPEELILEVRYVNSEGIGMTEFPQLPITLDGTLWEAIEIEGAEEEEELYEKGEVLFEGEIEHFWDSQAYLAKNKGRIPWDKIPVRLEDEKLGIMDVRVHLEQEDFTDIIDEIELYPKKEGF